LVLVLLIGGGWFVGVRNHMVELDQQVQAQWAQVENDYQRRFDLIRTSCARCRARRTSRSRRWKRSSARVHAWAGAGAGRRCAGTQSNLPNDPNAMAQFAGAQENLTGALSRLLVVVERYPELKSNQNFLELQSQLEGTENRIAVERRRL